MYVVVVRDRFVPESISFVWNGGDTLEEAQQRRSLLEKQLREFSGDGPSHVCSIHMVAEQLPAWEESGRAEG